MKKLHMYLLMRLFVTMTVLCAVSVSSLAGVIKAAASTVSQTSQMNQDAQVVSSSRSKTYNDTDEAWTYIGQWSKDKVRHTHGGQIHVSYAADDHAIISITGSHFTLVYSTARTYGELDVFVDEVKIDTINQKKSKTSHQKEWNSPELTSGTHVLKFVHTSGKAVNIDAIKVHGPKKNPVAPSVDTPTATTTFLIPLEDINATASPVPSEAPIITETPGFVPTELVDPTVSPIPTHLPMLEITPSPTDFVPLESPTSTSLPTVTSNSIPVEIVPSPTSTPSLVPSPTPSPTYTPTHTATFTPSPTATAFPTIAQTTGKTYYVATTGSDTNPGTQDQPFRTIQKAVNLVAAGDTVYVRGGIYNEIVNISKAGKSNAPITISSYPNEQAIIDGKNTLPGNRYAKLVGLNGSYTIFKNFEIKNSNGRGIQIGGSYNSINGNNVHHIWDTGIYIVGSNITVENNRVWRAAESNYNRNNGDWSGGIAWGAPFSPNAAPNAVIRGNHVYQNSGEGIICMYTDNGMVDRNIVYDNWAMNIYVDQCSNMTIQNNLVYYTADKQFWRNSTAPKGGIVLANEGIQSYPIGHDRKIINNILIANGTNIGFWIGRVANASLINDLVANNTLVNAYASGIGIDSASHQQTRIINNIVLQSRGAAANVRGSGITFSNNLWYPLNGITGPGDIRQDPLLVNPAAPILAGSVDPHWYSVRESSSPAINTGTLITSITSDFDGVSRPGGPQYDIGAFER